MAKHSNSIDGLKGMAVLFVLLYHLFPHIFPGGFLAVSYFFVLSGFLLMTSAKKQFSTTSFYLRRIQRIFIPLFWMFFISCGVMRLINPELLDGIQGEISSIFLGYNNYYQISKNASYFTQMSSPFTHLWSLAIEIQFYILFPLFLMVRPRYLNKVLLMLICISISTLEISYLFTTNVTFVYYGTIQRSFSFFVGMWMANTKPIQHVHKYILIAIEVYLLATLFTIQGESSFTYQFALLLTTLLFAFLLKVSYDTKYSNFNNRAIVFLGKYSYEIYLWQYPIIFFFIYNKIRVPLQGIVIIGLIIGMAYFQSTHLLTLQLPTTKYLRKKGQHYETLSKVHS